MIDPNLIIAKIDNLSAVIPKSAQMCMKTISLLSHLRCQSNYLANFSRSKMQLETVSYFRCHEHIVMLQFVFGCVAKNWSTANVVVTDSMQHFFSILTTPLVREHLLLLNTLLVILQLPKNHAN